MNLKLKSTGVILMAVCYQAQAERVLLMRTLQTSVVISDADSTKVNVLRRTLLEQENLLTYSLIAGIVLMLLMLVSVYLAYRTTKQVKNSLAIKNQEIQLQKDYLDKLNTEKDRFFSILSHDIRGPLNALKGFSFLLGHADTMSPEEIRQMKEKIDKSLDNLTELINNILEWSMTSAGKRKWTFEKVDVDEIIRKNISLYQAIAEGKKVNLAYKPSSVFFAYGDYFALDSVIRNLISNAVKFSHTTSDVFIKITQTSDRIFITVKDQGIGIPEDIQKKLFTLGSNIVQRGTNNEKGSGLGLVLCKELLHEINGVISVTSHPGQGSEFVVSIPAYKEEANQL